MKNYNLILGLKLVTLKYKMANTNYIISVDNMILFFINILF